jgi:hypothetical protein
VAGVERNARVQAVTQVLSSEAAAWVAAHLHLDLGAARGRVPTLSDAELRDLACLRVTSTDRRGRLRIDAAPNLRREVT